MEAKSGGAAAEPAALAVVGGRRGAWSAVTLSRIGGRLTLAVSAASWGRRSRPSGRGLGICGAGPRGRPGRAQVSPRGRGSVGGGGFGAEDSEMRRSN